MDIIIDHIKTNEDSVCGDIRHILCRHPPMAEILVVHYLSIRSLYDIPCLLNITYRQSKPTTHIVFDVEKVLLAVLIIQVECANALLNYINTYHRDKVYRIYDILDEYMNIDLDVNILQNSPSENFTEYVNNINKYVSKINEILN